jgi:hypothetical protein
MQLPLKMKQFITNASQPRFAFNLYSWICAKFCKSGKCCTLEQLIESSKKLFFWLKGILMVVCAHIDQLNMMAFHHKQKVTKRKTQNAVIEQQ